MRCIVTAGPSYEPLDQVRRLTNFSTGRLGTELCNFLVNAGHETVLLIGEYATYSGEQRASSVQKFSTSADLAEKLQAFSGKGIDGVFHAAAIGDYKFGNIWTRSEAGELVPVHSGKLSTRDGTLLAELLPTPKIIAQLRQWFPASLLVGWKFEVDGDTQSVIELARRQLDEWHTDACVANGPAYGAGFGLVSAAGPNHFIDRDALFTALERILTTRAKAW